MIRPIETYKVKKQLSIDGKLAFENAILHMVFYDLSETHLRSYYSVYDEKKKLLGTVNQKEFENVKDEYFEKI